MLIGPTLERRERMEGALGLAAVGVLRLDESGAGVPGRETLCPYGGIMS